MCQLCNGTHVVNEIGVSSMSVSCCPTCGPDKTQNARFAEILADIAQIRLLERKGA